MHRGNTHTSGKQHTWTSTKEVNDREVERQRQRDAHDPNKFNMTVGAFNPPHPNQQYYGDNRGYYGPERHMTDSRGYNNSSIPQPPPLPHFEQHQSRGFHGLVHPADRHHELNRSNLGTNVTTNTSTAYGYSQPFTKSDWDHYAVRHEDALIGDPIAYADNSLNPQFDNRRTTSRNHNGDYDRNHNEVQRGTYMGPYDNDSVARGRNQNLNHTLNAKNQLYTHSTNYEGPIAFDTGFDANGRPLKGNYASGSVIENGSYARNGGAAWGSEPLFGNRGGNDLLWRDYRDNRTPLLPENPWTHNELGREYLDGRKDHLYKHTDDAFVNSNNTKKYAMNDINGRNPSSARNINTYEVPRHETTRSYPGGFVNNSSVPQPPPLPQWNAHADNHAYRPRSFNRDHDYTSYDPRHEYHSTHTY